MVCEGPVCPSVDNCFVGDLLVVDDVLFVGLVDHPLHLSFVSLVLLFFLFVSFLGLIQ